MKNIQSNDPAVLKAAINYLYKLTLTQHDVIEKYQQFVHTSSFPSGINDASAREWSQSIQIVMLKRDNLALRELSEEYREIFSRSNGHQKIED